jgi:ribosome biogenesis GTPase / thiamine phosphate phosphatase
VALKELGWDLYFEAVWRSQQRPDCVPGRVVSQQRGLWRIAGDFAECWAGPSGKLRSAGEANGEWLVVGDWVAAELTGENQRAAIQAILPRRTRFARKVAGKGVEEQVIAANVDTLLLVCALDGDFNLRRLERYLAQCWASGVVPVVVLNKADQCDDVVARTLETQRIANGVPVFALSALAGEGIDVLRTFLSAGLSAAQTIVVLGSSGAGKSTLLNRLLGREVQKVQAVRERDGRGQHTTTTRELFLLPCGAVAIDTPGLRELQLWDAEEGMARAFADIDELASQCRFRDCRHGVEPGCAVRAALENGELDPERLASRRKLEREQEFLRRKVNAAAREDARDRMKVMERVRRQRYRQRDEEGKG